MDSQIEELKELVRQNIAVSAETNKLVHKMRRSQRWGRVMTALMWIIFVFIPLAASYYYLQPYLGKVEQIYSQVEAGDKQAQNLQTQAQGLGSQISSFFGNWLPAGSTTTTQ